MILCFISSIECVIWLPEVRAPSEHRACAHTFQIFLQQTKKKSLKIMILVYKSDIKLDTVTAVRYRVIEHLVSVEKHSATSCASPNASYLLKIPACS